MTSVSASGGGNPVRLCRIVPQTNDPPAWLKAGRAFSFLAALTPRPLRRSIVTVRIPRPSSPLGFRSTGFGASVIIFPVIALQGRQIASERLCGHPRTVFPVIALQGRQIASERLCGHPRRRFVASVPCLRHFRGIPRHLVQSVSAALRLPGTHQRPDAVSKLLNCRSSRSRCSCASSSD